MSINGRGFDLRAQNAAVDRARIHALMSDGIIRGCALTFTGTSITMGVGSFVVQGAITEIDAAETTDLSAPIANGYVRLIFHVDLDEVPSTTEFTQGWFTYDYSATLSGFSALTQEDINGTGSVYEKEIGVWTMVSSECTALVRSIAIAGTLSGVSGNSQYIKHADGTLEQWGWGWVREVNGTSSEASTTITFPVEFTSIYTCITGLAGYKLNSDPTVISDLDGLYGGVELMVFTRSVTLKSFVAHARAAATMSSSARYGFMWSAKGKWK